MVRGTVEETLNAMLDAEADRLCGAGRYERSEGRQDTRAGSYERTLHTKAGDVSLKVPKLRRQTFETAIIERYRRRESSVEEALIEMYLAGISVRRVDVQDNLRRAAAAGLAWPLEAEVTDEILERRLFARAGVRSGFRRRAEPDWALLARELKRPGVNLMVLWEEYRDRHPDGYGYSRFCDLFREFERRLSPVMRQHHAAGDKVFVDYSGKKIGIVDPETGVVREAEIFVAVLGASNYTYAEATWSQMG